MASFLLLYNIDLAHFSSIKVQSIWLSEKQRTPLAPLMWCRLKKLMNNQLRQHSHPHALHHAQAQAVKQCAPIECEVVQTAFQMHLYLVSSLTKTRIVDFSKIYREGAKEGKSETRGRC